MKVTMLYFKTISKLIKKYGFSWEDVESIQDHKGRVRFTYVSDGCERSYTDSFLNTFYCTHMGGFNESGEREQILIQTFLTALKEAREQQTNQPFGEQEALEVLDA